VLELSLEDALVLEAEELELVDEDELEDELEAEPPDE